MLFALVTTKNHGKQKLSQLWLDPQLEQNRLRLDQRIFELIPLFTRNIEIIASAVAMPTTKKPQPSIVSLVEDTTDSEQPIFVGHAASLANPDTFRIKPRQGHLPPDERRKKTEIRLAKGTSSWHIIRTSTTDAILRMK
jgi:hypothetical protein